MALSKKHFINFAASINAERINALSIIVEGPVTQAEQGGRLAALENLANDLCVTFRNENPLFDKQRFLTACGF